MMTELSAKIDRDIGNDTEQARLTFLKYVNYGRRLAIDELAATAPQFSKADLDAQVAVAEEITATMIIGELRTILDSTAKIQAAIEQQEDARMLEFAAMKADGPIKAELVAQFQALIDSMNKQHSEVVHSRDLEIKALLAKYESPKTEAPKA